MIKEEEGRSSTSGSRLVGEVEVTFDVESSKCCAFDVLAKSTDTGKCMRLGQSHLY